VWLLHTQPLERYSRGSTRRRAALRLRRSREDKGEVLDFDAPNRLSVTHYSPLMGQADAPENYHTIAYTLSGGDGPTTVALTQDGDESALQAEQFSATRQGMLESLKRVVESV
jgi:hypothetical protein